MDISADLAPLASWRGVAVVGSATVGLNRVLCAWGFALDTAEGLAAAKWWGVAA
ncbi:hypothetical protein ACWGCW_01980 [Streptomyces sp. NPDC054933]